MKKITLFAAAAVMASTAVAEAPQQPVKVGESQRAEVGTVARRNAVISPALNLNLNSVVAEAASRADDVVTVTNDVDYVMPDNSFYLSFTPGCYRYPSVSFAFTGIRNSIGFYNLTQGADAFSWKYGRVTGLTEDRKEYTYDYTTSADNHLFMPLKPMARFSYPELTATFGTDETTKTPNSHSLIHCGRNTIDWNFTELAEGVEEVTSWTEVYGVTNCTALPSADLFPEFSISRPGASGYDAKYNDANGTSLNWYDYSSADYSLENIKITSFATYIPPMPSPYQLDAMWMWFQSEATSDLTLTVSIYNVNDDGTVNYDELVGTGELIIPEGKCSPAVNGSMPVVEITAVDADGYAIDSPLCVGEGQDIFVRLDGLDNEALLQFDAVAYSTTTYPVGTDEEVVNAMWPARAYTIFTADATDLTAENPETINRSFMLRPPYGYYTDNNHTDLITISNFVWNFSIDFPIVMNPDESSADYQTANFNIEVPATGGEVTVPVGCDYKIDVLMENDLVQAVSSDWLTFTQAYDEESGVTNVTINAQALPEGTEGRKGYVVYVGYAIDFVIEVTQGDMSGINNITVMPVAKGTKFFDMQGRRLSAAPAHGMYIESVNGKATKRFAR